MKSWSATAAKFYSETMNGLAAFFGMNAEETTEAELHQKLVEAGTLENIRAAATKEANDAVAAQMADFQTKLDVLTGQVENLQADADAKTVKVGELETELEAVRGEVAGKDIEIEGLKKQNVSLSGEVAGLKAGKPIDKSTPPDASKPIEQSKAPNGGVIVSGKEMEEAYAKAVASNN